MRQLPDRPDLDQLRRQARELHRAAAAGDLDASRRLQAVSPRATRRAAQLALAREHGFSSWAQLKAEVERRRLAAPEAPSPPWVIRSVESMEELAEAFDVIGAQMTPSFTHEDLRFGDLARCFPGDRSLMLVVEDRGRIAGGALAFRTTLRVIGLVPDARGKGLGRRLVERLELEAMRLGRGGIALGASGDVKGFYRHLGYAGRRSMMHKELPLPGRALEARLRKLTEAGGGTTTKS